MAQVEKASLPAENDALQDRFACLCADGQPGTEGRARVAALLPLLWRGSPRRSGPGAASGGRASTASSRRSSTTSRLSAKPVPTVDSKRGGIPARSPPWPAYSVAMICFIEFYVVPMTAGKGVSGYNPPRQRRASLPATERLQSRGTVPWLEPFPPAAALGRK